MKALLTLLIALLGTVGAWLISLAMITFYGLAFVDGAEAWFGWEPLWAIILYVGAMLFAGPVAALGGAVVGGYCALMVWNWPLWLVIIVFFPAIPFIAIGLVFSLLSTLFRRSRASL